MMKRRQFVQTMGAGSALGSLGLLSGCASSGCSNGPKVVVGGGYGGATAAKYVRSWSDHGIQVTLVEPQAAFVSCPISNLVIGGVKSLADITMGAMLDLKFETVSREVSRRVREGVIEPLDRQGRLYRVNQLECLQNP